MTPELSMAVFLGSLPTTPQEKLAQRMAQLSNDELEELILGISKTANYMMDDPAEQRRRYWKTVGGAVGLGAGLAVPGTLRPLAMAGGALAGGVLGSAAHKTVYGPTAMQLAMKHASVEKVALSPAFLSGAKHLGGRILHGIASSSTGQRALVGGGLGAAAGAAKGLIAPGVDPQTGQQRGRLGAAVRGGIGGGVVGAGVGVASRPILKTLRSTEGAVGNSIRGLMANSAQTVGERVRSGMPDIARGQRLQAIMGRNKSVDTARATRQATRQDQLATPLRNPNIG